MKSPAKRNRVTRGRTRDSLSIPLILQSGLCHAKSYHGQAKEIQAEYRRNITKYDYLIGYGV